MTEKKKSRHRREVTHLFETGEFPIIDEKPKSKSEMKRLAVMKTGKLPTHEEMIAQSRAECAALRYANGVIRQIREVAISQPSIHTETRKAFEAGVEWVRREEPNL